jgi:hypothetical protein
VLDAPETLLQVAPFPLTLETVWAPSLLTFKMITSLGEGVQDVNETEDPLVADPSVYPATVGAEAKDEEADNK